MAYPVPYVQALPGGLSHGRSVSVQGTSPHHHHEHGFSVNLCCSADTEFNGDVALHFNPRFNERSIVMNSVQYGAWGASEKHHGLPFTKGQPFEITLSSEHHHIKISVNGKHLCNFRHRIPQDRVQYLIIKGAINISFIRIEGGTGGMPAPPPAAGGYYPPAAGGYYPPAAGAFPGGGAGGPIYNPPVPLTTTIPGNLYPGKMICISGIPHGGASRFHVNLQCGAYSGSDIALHFDVRFNYGSSVNQVIRNHQMNGSWGSEEKHASYFPFMQNANFELMILVEPSSFKVAVNNQHFIEFGHRLQPLSRIDTLCVEGDVRLTQVRFQ